MVKWRILVEYEEAFTGANIVEIEADNIDDASLKMKEKIAFLQPNNFSEWKKSDECEKWHKQKRYCVRHYLLNIFEPDFDRTLFQNPKKEEE